MGSVPFEADGLNTKWPEFVIPQFQEKRNGEGVSSAYTDCHFSPSQRGELLCVRLVSNQGFDYIAYVVNRGSRQLRSPMM